LQVKEAYEHFERKYNPDKYINVRQGFTKFEEEMNSHSSTSENNTDGDAGNKEYESIREKNKKKNSSATTADFEFRKSESEPDFDASGNYYRDEQLKLDIQKQKDIAKFLFAKIPVPRSRKMIDRLDIRGMTIGKGKIFGPDDYLSFSLLTVFLFMLFMSRKDQYKSYTFENLENVNIYNALKPSEINKLYEENEISPIEQVIINSKEHQIFKDKKLAENIVHKTTASLAFGGVNDVPKLDIRKKFENSLKN
jgi:hypothetical protein